MTVNANFCPNLAPGGRAIIHEDTIADVNAALPLTIVKPAELWWV